MSLNSFGHLFRVTTWGESHGPALGATVDGTPPGIALDEARDHPDGSRRDSAGRWCSLITPVLKAACTHQAFVGASDCLQVFGGHGYVREWGIEQIVRDSRVAMIYEGTNEIQAIDLLVRKVLGDQGRALATLLDELRTELEKLGPVNPLAVEEHEEEVKRLDFLTTQRNDLAEAKNKLQLAIREIDTTARELFHILGERAGQDFRNVDLVSNYRSTPAVLEVVDAWLAAGNHCPATW